MVFKNIAIVGANGSLGKPVLAALLRDKAFEVTVIARHTSQSTVPSGVKLVKVDFTNHEALVEALLGIQALVLVFNSADIVEPSQKLINAAIDAGVERFIPSEFGPDGMRAPGNTELVFYPQIELAKWYISLAEEGKISYTGIATGPFLDWCLSNEFLGFDLKNKTVKLFDGGIVRFNTTTLEGVASAIVGVLKNPEGTKNKHLYIHNAFVTQKELLEVVESELGTFKIDPVDLAEVREKVTEALERGDYSLENIYGAIQAAIWQKDRSSAVWDPETDNSELLGVKPVDIKEITRQVIKAVV